ncbi:MAG: AhpC/TSA family protein [Bacteroidales bacterium]|jgi:peroxiredoxin|nr:AhpC/TSA family protein [Bacteroidales bacterium]
MKNNLILFLIVGMVAASCKSNNIDINVKLINPTKGEYVYLDELQPDKLVTVDSAMVSEDGTFIFSRNVENPSFYLLKTDETNFLTMLLEPGQNIKITAYRDSLNYPAIISGSKGTALMNDYNIELRKTIGQLKSLREVYLRSLNASDLPAVMDRLDSLANIYLNNLNTFTKKYIDENLTSLISMVALYQQAAPNEYVLNPEKDIKYFLKVDSALSLEYPEYEPVKSLHEQVQALVADLKGHELSLPVSGGGTEAPEISLPGPQGDTIKLSSTRGKVVLLDFWASWCSPCRRENPNLVKAYETYHSKGFEIFQVSLDKTREAWLKGIADDHLEKWIHVSDVKYWNSVVVPLYSIESIPANFLLDKDGMVIASNLRGEMLQVKLEEVFGK